MANRTNLALLVNDYNRTSAQINCLTRTPNSVKAKLDPNFATGIESQPNPSLAYKKAMNHLFVDQLSKGLQDQQRKREYEGNKNDSLDGVLCQLEKNGLTHNLNLQKKLQRQDERKERFIDENKRKSQMIDSFVDKQYDSNVFNHQSDMYQQHQRYSLQNSLSMLHLQRQSKITQNEKQKQQKHRQFEQRIQYQRILQAQKQHERILHKQSQIRYQEQLLNLVSEKRQRDIKQNSSSVTMQSKRHNPITNPIEYHIDNPYILKRMAEQQRR